MKKGNILVILSAALGFFIAGSSLCYAGILSSEETYTLGGPNDCKMVVNVDQTSKTINFVTITPDTCGTLTQGSISENYLCKWVNGSPTECKKLNFISERVLVNAGRTFYLYDGIDGRYKFTPNW